MLLFVLSFKTESCCISPGCSGLAALYGSCQVAKWLVGSTWNIPYAGCHGIHKYNLLSSLPVFMPLLSPASFAEFQNFSDTYQENWEQCHCSDYDLTVWPLSMRSTGFLVWFPETPSFSLDQIFFKLDFSSGWFPAHIPSVSVLKCWDYRIVSPHPGIWR